MTFAINGELINGDQLTLCRMLGVVVGLILTALYFVRATPLPFYNMITTALSAILVLMIYLCGSTGLGDVLGFICTTLLFMLVPGAIVQSFHTAYSKAVGVEPLVLSAILFIFAGLSATI